MQMKLKRRHTEFMKVWDDRLVLLQIGGSEPIEREHDERRTDEAEKHKNDKAD